MDCGKKVDIQGEFCDIHKDKGNLGSLKQLDCEGIDISTEKGKVNIVDIPGFEGTMDELDNLVNK